MIKLIGIGIIAFLLFILEQNIYKKLWNRGLTVSVDFAPGNIFEGEKGSLKEIIENRKLLPLSMLNVKFTANKNLEFQDEKGSRTTDKYYRNDVFMIGARQKVTRTLDFIGLKRGVYSITNIDLIASDLFLTSNMVDEKDVDATIYVYPKPYDSNELRLSLKQLNGEILAKRHLLEDPFEYRGIREYQPFDNMRSINWKASAKTGELKVNQKNYTALKAIRIFMNLEDSGVLKKTECVEASINIAAGLCKFFLAQGMQVSLHANCTDMFSGEILSLDANGGMGQMESVFRALARCNIEDIIPFDNCLKEKLLKDNSSSFTCIVSPNHYDDFVKTVSEFEAQNPDLIWFYPVWESSDPQVEDAIKEYIRFIHIRENT